MEAAPKKVKIKLKKWVNFSQLTEISFVKDGLDLNFKKMQSIQMDYLSRKLNAESDLMNKFRNYYKQRSALESDYAKNLQRLSQQFSVNANLCNDLGFSNRSLFLAWNSYLEDNTKISHQHNNLSKFYDERVNDLSKYYSSKAETSKKGLEQLSKLHHEILLSVRDADKYRRDYVIGQSTYEGLKAKIDKYNKRKSSFTLTKSSQDIEQIKEQCASSEKQKCTARNMYIIQLRKLAVQYERFITTDFPKLITDLEENIYQQLQNFLSTCVCIELQDFETASKILQAMMKEVGQVLSVDEQRQCFYACNPALNCPVTLNFEPCQSDSVRTLKVFDPNDTTLTSEARTSYATLIRSQKQAADCIEKLTEAKNMIRYSSNSTVSLTRRKSSQSSSNSATAANASKNLPTQIQILEESLRKAETNRAVAEAVLNELRLAGVITEDLATDGSSALSSGSRESSRLSINSSEVYDTVVDWKSKQGLCLYTYTAKQRDELSFNKGDYVTVLENPSGKDWFKAQNSRGDIGLVPNNYIDYNKTVKPGSSGSNDSALNSSEALLEPEFWCEALMDYTADSVDELTINDGDLIGVINSKPHMKDDGWWKGVKATTYEEGLINELMVQKLNASEAQQKLRQIGYNNF